MEIASFIELLTPLVPHYFLILASIANIGKGCNYHNGKDDNENDDCYNDDVELDCNNDDDDDTDT